MLLNSEMNNLTSESDTYGPNQPKYQLIKAFTKIVTKMKLATKNINSWRILAKKKRNHHTAQENWQKLRIAQKSLSLQSYTTQEDIHDIFKNTIYSCITTEVRGKLYLDEWESYLKILFRMKVYWDLMISFILSYYLIVLPYRLTFHNDNLSFKIIEAFLDIILAIDSFYNLRINLKKFQTEEEVLMVNLKILLLKPLTRLQLCFQLILSFPFEFISFELNQLKILRIIYIDRISITFDNFLNYFFRTHLRYTNEVRGILMFVKGIFLLLYIDHILTCYWIQINLGMDDMNWYSDWINNHQETTDNEIYLESFFSITGTLSTVGYGTVQVIQYREKLFIMLVEYLGVLLYSFLLSSVKYAVKQFSIVDEKLSNHGDEINFWLFTLNKKIGSLFPRLLWNRCKMIMQQNSAVKFNEMFQSNEFFRTLSCDHQKFVTKRTFSNILELFSWYFVGLSDDFVFEFLLRLTPIHMENGKIVIKFQSKPSKIYFIMNGRIFAHKPQSDVPEGFLKKYDILGDYMVLLDTYSDYSFIVTPMKSVLFFTIDECSLLELNRRFKEDIMILKRNILNRLKTKGEFHCISGLHKKSYTIKREINEIKRVRIQDNIIRKNHCSKVYPQKEKSIINSLKKVPNLEAIETLYDDKVIRISVEDHEKDRLIKSKDEKKNKEEEEYSILYKEKNELDHLSKDKKSLIKSLNSIKKGQTNEKNMEINSELSSPSIELTKITRTENLKKKVLHEIKLLSIEESIISKKVVKNWLRPLIFKKPKLISISKDIMEKIILAFGKTLKREEIEEDDKEIFVLKNNNLDNSIDLSIDAMDIYDSQNIENKIKYLDAKLNFLKNQFSKFISRKEIEIKELNIFVIRKVKILNHSAIFNQKINL